MGRITNTEDIRRIILDAITLPNGAYPNRAIKHTVIESMDHNRFLVIRTGWDADGDNYAVIQDVEIKDNVVFIHQDNMQYSLKEELVEAGIPKENIIEAFVAPGERNVPNSKN
jgi:hypothetical protein